MAVETRGDTLDVFIDARAKSPELEKVSRSFFTPTVLDSEEARDQRERYERFQFSGVISSPFAALSGP